MVRSRPPVVNYTPDTRKTPRHPLILDGLCLHVLSSFQRTGLACVPRQLSRRLGNLSILLATLDPVNRFQNFRSTFFRPRLPVFRAPAGSPHCHRRHAARQNRLADASSSRLGPSLARGCALEAAGICELEGDLRVALGEEEYNRARSGLSTSHARKVVDQLVSSETRAFA